MGVSPKLLQIFGSPPSSNSSFNAGILFAKTDLYMGVHPVSFWEFISFSDLQKIYIGDVGEILFFSSSILLFDISLIFSILLELLMSIFGVEFILRESMLV